MSNSVVTNSKALKEMGKTLDEISKALANPNFADPRWDVVFDIIKISAKMTKAGMQ